MVKRARSALSLTVAALLFMFIATGDAYIPRMLNGRPRRGFVGVPAKELNQSDSATPPEQWYEQRLNHFNGADLRFWKQRYFVNETWYQPGGPLFVMIGGEGAASAEWVVKGAWMDYAQTYQAYCVLLEHRYYGKSHPTLDMGTENLKYLNSEQALADLARFITDLSTKLGQPKVITFGGSYPGNLAAWFRMKYPHISHGSVASSAPVLAKVDFKEYLEVVSDALDTYEPSGSCTKPIWEATTVLKDLIKTADGRKKVQEMFKLCDAITDDPLDHSNLFATLADNFAGVVQYNKDNRQFEGATGTNVTIDVVCDTMTEASKPPIMQYAEVSNMLLAISSEKCLDFKYSKMVSGLQKTSWNSSASAGGRQWIYQTCTEFAYYQTSDSEKQPFGNNWPIDFWTQMCTDIFGKSIVNATIWNGVKWSNINYGGLGLKITRVLFPNGSIDPWHALGILKDIGPDAKAIFIKGTAHCADMYPSTDRDLPALRDARQEISSSIGRWLKA